MAESGLRTPSSNIDQCRSAAWKRNEAGDGEHDSTDNSGTSRREERGQWFQPAEREGDDAEDGDDRDNAANGGQQGEGGVSDE